MTKWYAGITEQEFTDAINDAVVTALRYEVNENNGGDKAYDAYVRSHLKLWKESGVDAPVNEGNSIQAWLRFLGGHSKEETLNTMRIRMLKLMNAAQEVYDLGPEAEDALGIYDNRPDMDRGR
jgi:hypothetical protein